MLSIGKPLFYIPASSILNKVSHKDLILYSAAIQRKDHTMTHEIPQSIAVLGWCRESNLRNRQ